MVDPSSGVSKGSRSNSNRENGSRFGKEVHTREEQKLFEELEGIHSKTEIQSTFTLKHITNSNETFKIADVLDAWVKKPSKKPSIFKFSSSDRDPSNLYHLLKSKTKLSLQNLKEEAVQYNEETMRKIILDISTGMPKDQLINFINTLCDEPTLDSLISLSKECIKTFIDQPILQESDNELDNVQHSLKLKGMLNENIRPAITNSEYVTVLKNAYNMDLTVVFDVVNEFNEIKSDEQRLIIEQMGELSIAQSLFFLECFNDKILDADQNQGIIDKMIRAITTIDVTNDELEDIEKRLIEYCQGRINERNNKIAEFVKHPSESIALEKLVPARDLYEECILVGNIKLADKLLDDVQIARFKLISDNTQGFDDVQKKGILNEITELIKSIQSQKVDSIDPENLVIKFISKLPDNIKELLNEEKRDS